MADQQQRNLNDLSEQAMKLAEQLGRIAGSIEGTAEAWLERQQLTEQLTRVRDGAASMLGALTREAQRSRALKKSAGRNPTPTRQAADPSRAPGKQRRKPAPTMRGVKKADTAIPKLRTAKAVRQRRKSYA